MGGSKQAHGQELTSLDASTTLVTALKLDDFASEWGWDDGAWTFQRNDVIFNRKYLRYKTNLSYDVCLLRNTHQFDVFDIA